tara:strand:+ start:6517 stop:7155 length:639 start_codon:yes stop_codon:yes gene_type:complete
MVESNNNQFYIQYHTPRPRRIQTPKSNVIAKSIANARKRNPIPVRTQRIKSTPRRVTKQTPVNYKKIVKEAINKSNEANAAKALLNLNPKPDANKEKIKKYRREWRASRTEAQKEAVRQRDREYYRKKRASMTEANIEANREKKRKYKRELRASMTEANKEAQKQYFKELYRKRRASMTEANKEAESQHRRELVKKRKQKVYKSRPKSVNKK